MMFLPTAMFFIYWYLLIEKLTFVCLSFHLCKKSSWFFQCQFHMYDATHNVTSSKILWHESETTMTCLYKYIPCSLREITPLFLSENAFLWYRLTHWELKKMEMICLKFFFTYLKKTTDICWTLKKWGGKKELRKPLSMTLLSLDSALYHNLHVQLSCIRTC